MGRSTAGDWVHTLIVQTFKMCRCGPVVLGSDGKGIFINDVHWGAVKQKKTQKIEKH